MDRLITFPYIFFSGRLKFNIATDVAINFVLNEDGTEIDQDFFPTLIENSNLMLLKENESWTPCGKFIVPIPPVPLNAGAHETQEECRTMFL